MGDDEQGTVAFWSPLEPLVVGDPTSGIQNKFSLDYKIVENRSAKG